MAKITLRVLVLRSNFDTNEEIIQSCENGGQDLIVIKILVSC